MACGCTKRKKTSYLWYSTENPEGLKPTVYNSDIEAKAKVHRRGGTYIEYNPNVPIGVQVAAAEAQRAEVT